MAMESFLMGILGGIAISFAFPISIPMELSER